MRSTRTRFRVIVFVVFIGVASLFSFCWIGMAWSFDYFGWHTRVRWLTHAGLYKTEVMSQPTSPNNLLRHVEWDGWGFPGAGDTVTYLVFDPSERLLDASRTRRPGKYIGIPCEVLWVNRMEKSWFTVRFYTEQDWNHCE